MREKASASVSPRLSRQESPTRAGCLAAALAAAILQAALPAAAAEPPEKALLRLHVTSHVSVHLFTEVDWDVLISTSGKMHGYTTCECPFCVGPWVTVASSGQLSSAQLSALQAALVNGRIGILPGCRYLDGMAPGDAGTYDLQWYGRPNREQFVTLYLGFFNFNDNVPACSGEEVDLFRTIDDLVINVLGFPPTIAPATPTNQPNVCGEIP